MAKTVRPTGLSIVRDGMAFNFMWKIGDTDYGQWQTLQYHLNTMGKGKWTGVNISTATTSKWVGLNANDFYPYKKKYLKEVTFRVRGRRQAYTTGAGDKERTINPTKSEYASKTMNIKEPFRPPLTATLDSERDNITVFAWEATNEPDDNRPIVDVEWQTVLVRASNVTDGSKLSWKSGRAGWATGIGNPTDSITRTEETTDLARDSYTRWVRIRGRGPGGATAWRYAKHVYARPYKPKMGKVSASVSAGVTTISAEWTANANAAHPIDTTTVEYCFAVPAAGQRVPNDARWEEGAVTGDTKGTDAAKFSVSQTLQPDECLFVRVAVRHDHDSNVVYSDPVIARKASLTQPTNLSVSTESSTFRATVTATNESDVPDSRLAVVYRVKGEKDTIVGIIPNGSTSATVQCPDWTGKTFSFGVYAFQGTATGKSAGGGVTTYSVSANMKSSSVWDGGAVPVAPANVAGTVSGDSVGEVILEWSWSWPSANRAEISWSENPNAWESTEEPSTYMITNLNTPRWRVSDLAVGTTWYFRVRLAQMINDELTYGPYSDTVAVDLSSAPSIPVLNLSAAVITKDGSVTASWAYSTTDGTAQAYAEICEATIDSSGITYGQVIAKTTTAQSVQIPGSLWAVGTTHYLCVRVTSASGHVSDEWSAPVPITIADALTCTISATSLQEQEITEDGRTRTATCLLALPMTATITGAGEGGTTTLVIERAADYHMARPDDSEMDGYEGETIALIRQTGEDMITVTNDDLFGRLDDGAPYRLMATAEDSYGQTATVEMSFEVRWTHQAQIPEATVEMDGLVAKITPLIPEGYLAGDTCDIYRLSVDKPELIIEDGEFGTTYVDPFPAIGEHGGHRVVFKTVNGDYITADNHPAWINTGEDDGDLLDIDYAVIDFGTDTVLIRHNVTIDSAWAKDFKETQYLGGAIQGDWNKAVRRTGTVGTVVATDDEDTIRGLRRLAAYPGICHIRTQDGSSFAADIQVSEGQGYDTAGKIAEFSLTITRVDPEGYDGLTLAQWEREDAEDS